jgi:hypothetical protein
MSSYLIVPNINWRIYNPVALVPRTATVVAVIECEGHRRGALALFGTGIYAMLNAGCASSLDQHRVRSALRAAGLPVAPLPARYRASAEDSDMDRASERRDYVISVLGGTDDSKRRWRETKKHGPWVSEQLRAIDLRAYHAGHDQRAGSLRPQYGRDGNMGPGWRPDTTIVLDIMRERIKYGS